MNVDDLHELMSAILANQERIIALLEAKDDAETKAAVKATGKSLKATQKLIDKFRKKPKRKKSS